MTTAHWEHFHHEADIGVCGFGGSMVEAFEQAALALTAVITDPKGVRIQSEISIECQAPDRELLLADWLNALVFEMATRKMLFGRFDVAIDGDRLYAKAGGEQVDPTRHQPAVEIKGATYTELYVGKERDDGWRAQCVVDV